MKLLLTAALCALSSFVAGDDSGVVHYVRGLEVLPGDRDLAEVAVTLALHQGVNNDIAKDFRDIALNGLSQNATARVIQHIQQASGPLSADDIQRIWTTATGPSAGSAFTGNHSIALDLQSIAKDGVTPENGNSLMKNINQAIELGQIAKSDGPGLLNSIQDIIKSGANVKNGADIVDQVQTILSKVTGVFDPEPVVCRRQGVGRGVGTVLENQCLPGEEAWGALCYPKCKEGYESVGCCICRKKGCGGVKGATDIGVSCAKPSAYGRGVGYAIGNEGKCKRENGQGCEKNGAMWYPKCEKGFHNVGCCVCSPDCPAGFVDDGAFCRKDSYGRGVGVSRLGCPKHLEKSGLFCYPPCAGNQVGVGPVCWPRCVNPAGTDCGLFCTSSVATCVNTVVDIGGQSAKVTLSLVAQDYTGAIKTAVQTGGKYISLDKCPK
ncbi:hypothetical protein SPRG_15484 [Saprolegnia parasitica CBS 223.65]|uniref:Secreted protein n=1 Tax=Saprolegnia parasitica (strain CBS 223.65) TaxID=695850 RepID=A0A067BLN7_SAPPC|nr:hypothetical protein SPRG_15484 [Saprolegnia parasitica CBS 223.65]KDO19404.1 hypothetical protein SPRG_15484 [Saprolegnia parasitica CBS 223.65]|eukprot:XP_012209871.1 hypothetical protein SPRG_15484 [Saprolegnia parasitica CBS 223.65]